MKKSRKKEYRYCYICNRMVFYTGSQKITYHFKGGGIPEEVYMEYYHNDSIYRYESILSAIQRCKNVKRKASFNTIFKRP